MAESRPKKEVVDVTTTPESQARNADVAPGWKPTAEAKKQATTQRIIAIVLWVVAIAGEAFAIFWVLRQNPVQMWLLIVMFVVIGALSITGSLLWKKANRLDPASQKDAVRFFIQNQLGAIIAVIAFVPLIILVFTNKNMSGGQKAVAGIVGILVLAAASWAGVSTNPPSTEQYDAETQQVVALTGSDTVFWTKAGSVFHLCSEASAVNQQSADNKIYSGTVADAHAAGKERLTLQIDQEIKQCGLTPAPDWSHAPGDTAPSTEPSTEPTN